MKLYRYPKEREYHVYFGMIGLKQLKKKKHRLRNKIFEKFVVIVI